MEKVEPPTIMAERLVYVNFHIFNLKRLTVLTVLTTCSRFVPFWNAITGQL